MFKNIDDTRIKNYRALISPAVLIEELPNNETASQLITQKRKEASAIVRGQNDKLLVIVGPCSIHDTKAALEYAHLLKAEEKKWQDELCIIMRVYFEKPRTTIGWKGLINDPHLDGSYDINFGLRTARHLLLSIAELGLPAGTEYLDTIIPQYLCDLISWGAIGARTTESQVHRELASGLSMPIGFKNGTSGDVQIAVDALRAARHPHHFIGVSKVGVPAIFGTSGNEDCHVILRGSNAGTNFDAENISQTLQVLTDSNLPPFVMVDCSHGNSHKDYTRQAIVVDSLCEQMAAGSRGICGVMLESFLVADKQAQHHGKDLIYGQSITDACLSWEETKPLLKKLAAAVKQRRK